MEVVEVVYSSSDHAEGMSACRKNDMSVEPFISDSTFKFDALLKTEILVYLAVQR